MRHFFKNYFFVLPVAIALLTGCSTEQEIVSPDDGDTKGRVTFAFPMSKGATTYATVEATGDESLFTTADMIVYMANTDGIIEAVFSGTSLTGSDNGTMQSVSVVLPNEVSSDKTFYFVANTSSVSGLSSIVEESKLADLLKLTTQVQATTDHLSSTGGLLLTGSVTVPLADLTTATPVPISVTLKRRVARFDVVNDVAMTKVNIKKILFSKAQLSALVFADKDSLPADKGTLPTIEFESSVADANAGTCLNVFYLYPSDSVRIQLFAEIGGMERLYNIPLPQGGIKANKSYTLKANNGASIPSFELVAEEWSAEEILASTGSPVEIVSSSLTGNAEYWDEKNLRYNATYDGATIEMTVSSLTPKGVKLEILDVPEGYDVITSKGSPATTPTYAAGYRQTVTIQIPRYEVMGKGFLKAKVVIKDVYDPSSPSKTISLVSGDYFPTAHKGWAGCNIYYDAEKGHLTFDDEGETEHEQYQGVYFQWGSLWGISPKGAWNVTDTSAGTDLYPPAGGTTTAYTAGIVAYDSIPRIPNGVFTPATPVLGKDLRDWSYTYQATDGATGRGDICRWLTFKGYAPAGKKWRMPTSREFGESEEIHSFGAFVTDINNPAVAAGISQIGSGRFLTNVTPNVFFPASGPRDASGALYGMGVHGGYWSGSPYSTETYGYYLYFNSGGVFPAYNGYRSYGFAVRCVAE